MKIEELFQRYYLRIIKNKLNKASGFIEVNNIINYMNSRYLTKDIFYLALKKGYSYSLTSPELIKSDLGYINMAIDNAKHRNQIYEILGNICWYKINNTELKKILKKIINRSIQENNLASTLFNIPCRYYNRFCNLIEFSSDDYKKLFISYTNGIDIYLNMHACLVLISKYHNCKEKNESLNNYYLSFLKKVTEVLMNHFKCDKVIIERYIEMIKNGISNPLNFIYIKDLNDLLYVIENGDKKKEKNPKYKKLTKKQV